VPYCTCVRWPACCCGVSPALGGLRLQCVLTGWRCALMLACALRSDERRLQGPSSPVSWID
jgi:hypothetical protein